ncbi:NUDIX domain-containing protein [Longispora albida]|uniref:NUDIX domain-containing protein n=1 Tax=Longispora albida TaxID=203523 RepID=UPI00036DD9DE|nr:NUDIX domain-containing protein [Longispora albida]
MGYTGSYLWQLRQHVGNQLVLMPGAQVVLVDGEGRILFQRRADTGEWDIPAGSCEENSTFASTAVTELAEETGIQVTEEALVPFGCLSDPSVHTVRYPNGDLTHCFAMLYEVRTWSGEITPEPGEVIEAAFHDPGSPPSPLQKQTGVALEMYLAYRRTGTFQNR